MFNSFAEIKELFEWDLNSLMDEIIKKANVQDAMIRLNHEQLQGGVDALGQTIVTIGGSPYRPQTVLIKRKKGQPTNRVTLKDTGEFYETFSVVILKEGYEITANFEKDNGSILDNFNSNYDFLGLEPEFLAEFAIEIILPGLELALKKQLGI